MFCNENKHHAQTESLFFSFDNIRQPKFQNNGNSTLYLKKILRENRISNKKIFVC